MLRRSKIIVIGQGRLIYFYLGSIDTVNVRGIRIWDILYQVFWDRNLVVIICFV